MNLNLAQKQALDDLVTGGVEPYCLSYDPNLPGTEDLESDAIAAGYTEFARTATGLWVEVIYTKLAPPTPLTGIGRFLQGGVAGKRVTFWGDSTTQVALVMWAILDEQITSPGGELAGVITTNLGLNGQTMAGASIPELVATNPDLVILCFGINDVRLGGVNEAEMQLRLTTKIAALKAAMPNCDLILWTPNSMLSVDVNNDGWVVPVANAQAYTDVMWHAYNNLVGRIPNTVHLDKQAIFGRTCQPSSPLMTDMLHPANDGQRAALAQLLPVITPPFIPIDLTASAAAWTSNPNDPWTVYSRALEDTRYCVKVFGFLITTYLDLSGTLLLYFGSRFQGSAITVADFQSADFIWTPNGVYPMTGSESYGTIGDSGVQCYGGISTAAFPTNTPPLRNAVLYRKL